MTKGSDKLLIAISAVASHGKTKTGKQLVRTLFHDKAFRALCPGFKVKKMGRTGKWVTEYTGIEGTGDWVAYFSAEKDANPLVAIITGGDDLSPEVKKEIDDAFSFPSVKIAVNACRPNNNVHDYLLEKAKEHLFQMVETSTFYVANHYCSDKDEEEALYGEWCDKRAEELKEVVKDQLSLADRLKIRELHRQMNQEKEKGRLAFLLGNGINKYATKGECPSWDGLIEELWKEISTEQRYQTTDEGYSLTEQFDILRNHQNLDATDADITKRVQEMVRKYYPGENDYYEFLRKRLAGISAPVLTTNFDTNLEGPKEAPRPKDALNNHTFPIYSPNKQSKLISEIFHWNEYYAKEPIAEDEIGRSFSVWHVHGNANQKKTIRLDLSAYMAQVTYTRNYLRDTAHLWAVEKEGDPWGMETRNSKEPVKGYAITWLNIFYNFSICINGLGLSKEETYLRWLLISRYKYQKRVGIKAKGWYIYGPGDNVTEGMKSFLRGVGFEPVMIEDYIMRYEELFSF